MITDGLDASDLDQYMGVPMEPGELKEPVATNDIRRWVQAMHYPNPLHYDEVWASESRFGEIVAPQSFTVATDTSHGCSPAQVGKIPNSHLIFGGDDWWFFGPRVWPGDKLVCHRMPYDYKVTDTKFAGARTRAEAGVQVAPERGERVALQLDEALVADEARERPGQVLHHVLGVEGFEGAIVTLMEQDQDSHYLRERELSGTVTSLGAAHQTLFVPFGFKGSAKVIDMAKEFEYTHG